MRVCTVDGVERSACSGESQAQAAALRLPRLASLPECKAACRSDPDCQGGYHAGRSRLQLPFTQEVQMQ